jgi:hypothetical protein
MSKSVRLFIVALISLLFFYGQIPAQVPIHGRIESNTYIDPRFGLRYTFPSKLGIQSSLPNEMPVGTGEKIGGTEFLFGAMENPNGQVRSGVLIIADDKGIPGVPDVRQYLKWILANSLGVTGEPDMRPVTIAGRSFYRSDAGVGTTIRSYGAQLATSCNGHYVIFVFSAASPARIENLIHSMDAMEMNCSAVFH